MKQQLGRRIAHLLAAEGVEYMFSLPEVTFGVLHDELDKLGIPLIAARHEAAAAHMAEAHTLVTGKIGVTGGSVGPGVLNLYPVVAHSWVENLPVLYLGSERTLIGRSSPRHSQFQYAPNAEVLKPITKWSTVLEDGRMVDDIFKAAFRHMTSGTPGPVYIGLPFDMLLEEHDYQDMPSPASYRTLSNLSSADATAVEAAAKMLAEADNPIVIAGQGVKLSQSRDVLEQLIQKLGCPVIQTFGGRGILSDKHPNLFDFAAGPGLEVTRKADVILAVGTSIGERIFFGGHPYFNGQSCGQEYFGGSDQKWIHMDRDPMAIGRNRPVDLGLVGDMAATLPRLIEQLGDYTPPNERAAQLNKLRQARSEYYDDLYSVVRDCDTVHPGQMILEVQKSLPDDVMMIKDGGAISIWQMNFLQHEISEFLSGGKMGQLGTGVPFANAAALTALKRNQRVCLMTGDGAFGFYAMEIETAVRLNLPILVVVGYDQGWSLEVPYYEYVVGRTFAVDHSPTRLDELARSLGAHGELCQSTEEIGPAIERSLASGKPAVVQVAINRRINAFEMPNDHIWTAWHADKEIYTNDTTENS